MNSSVFESTFFRTLPDEPGVYFFLDDNKNVLYIGKATSLRDRVRSYFSRDIFLTRGPKIERMIAMASSIEFQKTDSVLEALLLESELIKRHQPPYNTDVKDDKSWNMVVITDEAFPRVLVERGRAFARLSNPAALPEEDGQKRKRTKARSRVKASFGPFPAGRSLFEALRIIRKIFPFRDTCTPPSGLVPLPPKPCFNAQIGLCPGVCAGAISAKEYAKTIRHIRLFFSGKKRSLVRLLEKEMASAASDLDFERAANIKKTLFSLNHIRDVALVVRDREERLSGNAFRIEAYDVAHLGGSHTVGVMTVVQNGHTDPASYRKFILRGEAKGNDLVALEELLRRRLAHSEWTFPDALVVDGSDVQRHVAEAILRDRDLSIPVFSVLKDAHHKPKEILGGEEKERFGKSMLLANAEAHRFAISFHRKRHRKSFLS